MTTAEKTSATAVRQRKPAKVYTALEKVQAVLSVWSGRRKPGAVCRSMGIAWGLLNSWEKSALGGILKALGLETPAAEAAGLALGVRLEKLLAEPETAESKGE